MRLSSFSRRATARLLPVSAAAVATLSLTTVANAQPGGVGPACEVDANSPKEMFVANQAYQRAAIIQGDPAARQEALKKAMEELTKKLDKTQEKNPLGYAMLEGQILSLWVADETFPLSTTRGMIGAKNDEEAPIDLVQATNAAFNTVSAGAPACESTVQQLRQNEGWLAMTRRALDLSGTNPDSAKFYAEASLAMLPTDNPYPFQVLGVVAQRAEDIDGAIAYWDQAVEAAGTDTSYNDIRQSSLFYVGLYSLQSSREQADPQKTASLNKAATAMAAYLNDFSNSPDASTVMQGLGEAYLTLGDTAKVAQIYAPILATPSEFGDYEITMAGVVATQAERTEDAISLFDAAIKKNPNQRDALRNLAASYYTAEQFEEMDKPLAALLAIDPNNVDAWSMLAYAAQGKREAATEAPLKKQWTDSLVYYAQKADSLPVKVTIDNFERKDETAAVSLSLEGNADTPKANTLTVEFLDASGNVVSSASEEVAPITKGEIKSVKLEAQGAGIVAYRYKPLS